MLAPAHDWQTSINFTMVQLKLKCSHQAKMFVLDLWEIREKKCSSTPVSVLMILKLILTEKTKTAIINVKWAGLLLCCLSSSLPFGREFTKTSNTLRQCVLLRLLLLKKNLLQFSKFTHGIRDKWHKPSLLLSGFHNVLLMTDHVTSTQYENLEEQEKVHCP